MLLTEAALQRNLSPQVPGRLGFEFGIPQGGSTANQATALSNPRIELMEQLADTYMQCPWVSIPIDAIARTVTAGGLVLVPDDDIPEGETPPEPVEVKSLRRLLRFTNPREDMIQLLRATITDLLVFGDAYLEVTTVAGQPVAIYSLDAATMTVIADDHGKVTGYTQYLDSRRSVKFDPEQVIHISLDAPRGGLYGVSPTQKALVLIVAWLFTASCLKELMRRGDPPRVHADMPKGMADQDMQRWYESYMSRNLGVKNIGTPIVTRGGGSVTELSHSKVMDYLDSMNKLRDDILSEFGVPPSKAQVIESGNLGGGTGEAQDKTWRVNTIIPIANLLLEKLNYALVQVGFGIQGWHLEFEEIDFRDSAVVENIRIQRLIHGAYTFNRYRAEIGEPPIPGGDDAIIMDRGKFVYVKDMSAFTQAEINQMNAPLVAAGAGLAPRASNDGNDGTNPAVVGMTPHADVPANVATAPAVQGQPPKEVRGPDEEMRALTESMNRAYQARRRAALKGLPPAPTVAGAPDQVTF